MDKLKIAENVSKFTNPPIICLPLFTLICIMISFNASGFDFGEFIVLEVVSIIFASILPMAIILFWARRLGTDRDISNRSDRYLPLIVGIISYFIGFLICIAFNLDQFLTCLLLCYSINTGVVLLFTTKWKISVHTTGLSGPVAALILLSGPFGALFGVIYPILIWSRVLLKKHTLSQAICGGVQGFFLTVLEMYLFMHIFNFDVSYLAGLGNSLLFILAIIATPVLLGILSYIKTANSRNSFIIGEICLLVLFFILTPAEVFLIFVLITLVSVSVSFFAGEDFIWYRLLV